MNKLSNLLAWKRETSKRIQRALEELADTVRPQKDVRPTPVPVRIPVRSGNSFNCPQRRFSTMCGGLAVSFARRSVFQSRSFSVFTSNPESFFRVNSKTRPQMFAKCKWIFKLCNPKFSRFFGSNCHRDVIRHAFSRNSSGFMFGNFSQSYQNPYRLKLHTKNLNLTYRNVFCQVKDMLSDIYHGAEKANSQENARSPLASNMKTPKQHPENQKIALNSLCSSENHRLTLNLARTDSTATTEERLMYNHVMNGSYIEFPVAFDISIPNETILNDEVLEELLVNVKRFQSKLTSFKEDIVNLFELGELPIKYIKERQVLRIYFPNCDYQKLEALCKEKNVSGGIIYEDFGEEVLGEAEPEPKGSSFVMHLKESEESVYTASSSEDPISSAASTVVSKDDILSSSLYDSDDSCSSASSCYSHEEDVMLTSEIVHPLSNDEVVRLEFPVAPQVDRVSMYNSEFDDYYWVAA